MATIQNYTIEELKFKEFIQDTLMKNFNLRQTPEVGESAETIETPDLLKQSDYCNQNYYISKMILDIGFKETLFDTLSSFEVGMCFDYRDFQFEVLRSDEKTLEFAVYNWKDLLVGELRFDINEKQVSFDLAECWLRQSEFHDCDYVSQVMQLSVLLAKLDIQYNGIRVLEITTNGSAFIFSSLKQYMRDPNYEMWMGDTLITDTVKRKMMESTYSLGTYTDGSHDIKRHSAFNIENENGDIKLNSRLEKGNIMDDTIFKLQLRGNALNNALIHLKPEEDDEWNSRLFVDLAFTDCLQDIFLKETSDLFYFMSNNDGNIVNLATLLA